MVQNCSIAASLLPRLVRPESWDWPEPSGAPKNQKVARPDSTAGIIGLLVILSNFIYRSLFDVQCGHCPHFNAFDVANVNIVSWSFVKQATNVAHVNTALQSDRKP